ncbi:hypothetical protein LCGC14_1012510 [marine sediment metagenome]|uniref:Uncharacterized protein n=1 Tax=marine sediment metagenome TaxID=412755 RepID=A0A0F9MZY1_9ZZZZ
MTHNGIRDSSGRTLVAACRRDIAGFVGGLAVLLGAIGGQYIQSRINTATIQLEQQYQRKDIDKLTQQVENLSTRHMRPDK